MSRILLTYVGVVNGVKAYAPMDAEDEAAIGDSNTLVLDMKGERSKRTALQNRSMQKYWRMICERLNDSGWTKKKYYEVKEVDIGWTPESVGDDIWRGIQEAMYGHRSTSKLETHQVSKVYEIMDKHLSTTCGSDVSVPFPNIQDYIEQQLRK